MDYNSEPYSCHNCFNEYNTTDRLPKAFTCGHGLCLECLRTMFEYQNTFCPKCRVPINADQGFDAIPTSFLLLDVIEHRTKQKKEECPSHVGQKADIVCLEDKCKICSFCILYGDHKNHKNERFTQFKEQVDVNIVELERFIEEAEEWPQDVEKFLLEECEGLKVQLGERFDALAKFVMEGKEKILREVEKSFIVEIEKIKELGKEHKDMAKNLEELKKMVHESKSQEFKVSMIGVFDGKVAELMVKPQEYERSNVKEYCEKIKSTLSQDFQNPIIEALTALENLEKIRIKFPDFFEPSKIESKAPSQPRQQSAALNSNAPIQGLFHGKPAQPLPQSPDLSGRHGGQPPYNRGSNNPFAPKKGLFG